MKKVFLMLVVVIGFGFIANAGNPIQEGKYKFTELYKGQYMIEDTDRGMCLVTFSVTPTEQKGVLEVVCNGKTAKKVTSAADLAAAVAAVVPGLQSYSLIYAAVRGIYSGVCGVYNEW